MVRGLLFSGNGMNARQQQIDVIANNLANVSTTGYKREMVFTEALSNVSKKNSTLPSTWKSTDFSQGMVEQTGNKLDIAIQGEAFFSIEDQNEVRYSRNGSFKISDEGYLCTKDNRIVLGEHGPILVSGDFRINEKGEIIEDGLVVDQLLLVEFDDLSSLRKQGDGLLSLSDDNVQVRQAQEFNLLQGFIESSNVNAIEEMVNMIDLYRKFEADQKAIRTQDEMVGKAVNDVGRVA